MRAGSFFPVFLMVAGLLAGCEVSNDNYGSESNSYNAGYQAGTKWTSDQPPSNEVMDVTLARTPFFPGENRDDFRRGYLDAFHNMHGRPTYTPPNAGGA